ncbi:pre-peptidase C-terminal domain-containing protein [Zoogloea sp.]|uniref:pre-peptidase C-terminal domain-containing protein n=1 Tax=Zoogloea sp. TaxID=49181 RepID=UPI0035B3BE9D
MPVDNAGNTNTNARSIGLLGSTAQSFNDYVGSDDTNDYYRFTLDSTRNLSLTLSGLSADADLMLFNSTGGLLRLSNQGGTLSESITYNGLAAGTYFVRIYQFSGSTNYTLNARALPVTPSLSIAPLSANKAEGSSGSTPFTFTVTRSGDTSASTSVAYTLVHGNTNAADFSGSLGGTVSFGVGQTTQTITLNVVGDQSIETHESFSVVLSNAVNGSITTGSASAVIVNDDFPPDNAGNTLATARNIGTLGSTPLSLSDYVGSADTNDYYRFTLDATRNLRLTLAGLSADADLALLNSAGSVLRMSAVSGTVAENISYDGLAAGTYYVRVYPYSGSTNYTLSARALTPPTLSIAALSASKNEGNSGSTPFTFTVTRSGDLSGSSAVAYSLVHGSTAAADFSGPLGGTISFGVGQSIQTITINVLGDQNVEANESFSVVLSNALNGSITTGTATGTILNDDVAPPDYAGNTLATARNIGTLGSTPLSLSDYVGSADTNDYYRFTLDATRNLRLTLAGLSADADLALLNSAGSVLRTSAVSGTVAENISYDGLAAGTYYIRVYPYSGSTNYTLNASALTPTPVASISALSATKAEGNSGSTAFTFTVSRSSSVGIGTVAYAVQGAADASNTAASASDFVGNVLPAGTLSFADGELSKTLTIYVAGDTTIESNERFSVTLSNPSNLALGSSTVAYGIIQNDDGPLPPTGGINSSISQVSYITVPAAVDDAIDNLVGNVKWGGGIGTGAQLTYSFSSSASVFNYQNIFNGVVAHAPVSALNAKQQQVAIAAMGMVSAVANVTFTQVTDTPTSAGDIRWSITGSTAESTADAWFPSSSAQGGDIWIGTQYAAYADPDPGEYGYHTFIHELGHALGLEHPHDGSPAPLPGQDQLKYSVMSYKDFAGDTNNGYGTAYYPISYMLNDIAALQYLYGVNTSYHSGNDTYSWAAGARVYECIWDGGGTDTIDVGNQTQGCTINLNPGTWSSVGTAFSNSQSTVRDDLGIAYGAIIENATGSGYVDTLVGNGVNNRLIGGAGADTLTGNAGADSFVFRTVAEGGDTITDFSSAQGDKIQVVASNFGLTAGGTAVLQVGSSQPSAVGTGGQFLYASGTGQLWFDQDGTGSGQAVLLATLSNRPTLGASDIQLVSA